MAGTVTIEWLLAHVGDPDLIIADARNELEKPGAGKEAYAEGHIPGAVHFDLEHDLAGPRAQHGGRFPVPAAEQLADRFSRAGIAAGKQVVIYDDQGGMMASRLWWLLRYSGHERAAVLDEGFTAWKSKGGGVTREVPAPVPSVYVPQIQEQWLADAQEVRGKLGDADVLLLDARAPERYAGNPDAGANPQSHGHIPGAVNLFWKTLLDERGKRLDVAAIRDKYADLPKEREVIVYCGGGISATPHVLALEEAGFKRVKLYAGSWSDWISYADNPIDTSAE